ncbi:MAG TPA: cupin domain-containing protein [Gaiellaceae bacterium]|nr:cupin domain-containing protein [Gaiellaceae bacterium]
MDEPIALAPGEGEVLVAEPSRWSRIKVAREELFISESSYPADESGPRPHIHRQHADAFYVLEGELSFRVGSRQRRVSAGSFVLAPPGLVHGFEIGPDGVHHLNIHAPGHFFARLARARRDGIPFDAADGDTFPPPEDGGRPAADGIVLGPGKGEVFGTTVLRAARPELSLLELEVRPGGGVSPHFHEGHSDSFYVLEGELEVHLGDDVFRAGSGAYALAPPGVVHWFRNASDAACRVLNLHTPGGFGEYRRELETLRGQGVEPDRTFFERHDIFDVD